MKADKKQLRKDLLALLKKAMKKATDDDWDDLKEAEYRNAIEFVVKEHSSE